MQDAKLGTVNSGYYSNLNTSTTPVRERQILAEFGKLQVRISELREVTQELFKRLHPIMNENVNEKQGEEKEPNCLCEFADKLKKEQELITENSDVIRHILSHLEI